jgi:hypothetical protein
MEKKWNDQAWDNLFEKKYSFLILTQIPSTPQKNDASISCSYHTLLKKHLCVLWKKLLAYINILLLKFLFFHA